MVEDGLVEGNIWSLDIPYSTSREVREWIEVRFGGVL
jgi:hypothetical protein